MAMRSATGSLVLGILLLSCAVTLGDDGPAVSPWQALDVAGLTAAAKGLKGKGAAGAEELKALAKVVFDKHFADKDKVQALGPAAAADLARYVGAALAEDSRKAAIASLRAAFAKDDQATAALKAVVLPVMMPRKAG